MQSGKLIFLYSQSPRSGHNFVAEVIRKVVDCKTAIGDRSEIPLGPVVDGIEKAIQGHYKSADAEDYLNHTFFDGLRDKLLQDEDFMMVKYTSYRGADELIKRFPEDIHIVSTRDPRDCLISLFKGFRLKKEWKSTVKKLVMPFGAYQFSYARKYAKRILNEYPSEQGHFWVSYEDLVEKNPESIEGLINKLGSDRTVEEVLASMDEIKVINSSFFKEETSAGNMWESSAKTEKFNPINRKKGFNFLQLWGINSGSSSLRKRMGYI